MYHKILKSKFFKCIVNNEGFELNIPDSIVIADSDYILVSYKKIGTIYRFKAVAPEKCGYIDFLVNGVQNMVNDCSEATFDVDVSTLETKYLNVYVFGMGYNEEAKMYNKVIGSKQMISIDLRSE